MNANELYINKFYLINGDVCKFEDRHWYNIGECILFIEDIKPIPLTEEWLLKFGFFTTKTGKLIDATLPNFRFSLHKSGNYDGFLFCEKDNVITNIDYVHQIQNLYFALTNEELKINI